MSIQTWLAFVIASQLLFLIPGPTLLLVISYAISQGRSVALASVAGVALGDFIAMSTSLAGLGALVLASATLFQVIKWIGALYLIYLGIKIIRSASSAAASNIVEVGTESHARIFRHAAAVTALNPKSIVFFIAFVPQFIATDAPLLPQFSLLIATFVIMAALNAMAFALLADLLRSKITKPGVLAWLTRAGGGALVTMGVFTAAFNRSASS